MPWCAPCDRFLSPATVHADGTCPSCGHAVDPGRAHAPDPTASADTAPSAPASHPATSPGETDAEHGAGVDDDGRLPIPWHLWVLLAALTVYLGYRAMQGLEWVFGI